MYDSYVTAAEWKMEDIYHRLAGFKKVETNNGPTKSRHLSDELARISSIIYLVSTCKCQGTKASLEQGSAEMSDESRVEFYNISRRDCRAFDEANATQMDLESCHLLDFS